MTEQKTIKHIDELLEKENQRKDAFHRDIIAYFVKLKERKHAQHLLKRQVKHLRYKLLDNIKYSRPLTKGEQALIDSKLKLIQVGLENENESILDYKIRKNKEFQAHYQYMISEYADMRTEFFKIINEYHKDISLKAFKRSEVYNSLYAAVYHLITPYNNGFTFYHEKSIGFILEDIPHIKELMKINTFNSLNVKYFFMNYPNIFNDIIHYIAKNDMSLFINDSVLNKFSCFSNENIGKIEFFRTQMKIEKRLPTFKAAYTEYCKLVLND